MVASKEKSTGERRGYLLSKSRDLRLLRSWLLVRSSVVQGPQGRCRTKFANPGRVVDVTGSAVVVVVVM